LATTALTRATYRVTEDTLPDMVLEKSGFPGDFQGHQVVREGELDNERLASNGFAGSTAQRFREAGRVTGNMRELGPTSEMGMAEGFDFMAASVVHLFDTPESVSTWMHEIFLKDFEGNVGDSIGQGHQLVAANRLETNGFFDESVALRVLQGGPSGLISSTVVDFRLGRLLGVAFVVTVGDHSRPDLTMQIGQALERRMASVVLGV
jgi:hypothetical protein